jgi:S1-C subfamily serine protease
MKPSQDLIRQLPNLEELAKQLAEDPYAVAAPVLSQPQPAADDSFEAHEEGEVEVAPGGPPPVLGGNGLDLDTFSEVATRAVSKVREQGENADLDRQEHDALEAIVALVGRPPLFIQNGRLQADLGVEWQHLDAKRPQLEQTFASVGRIEVTGHASLDWVGTGFLVAENVIMTNRHVALEFCARVRGRWRFQQGMSARIDYVEEFGALASAEFALTSVIGVHENFDLALFRVERSSGQALTVPSPLPLATQPPSSLAGHQVYAVGYPAWDGRRNDPVEMHRIFQNRYDVKRCQPGTITRAPMSGVFVHDCSTLGGNSGSCVIDLETFRVLGLHFGGRYLQGNVAVALWELTNDPLLVKARLNWA